MCREGASSPPSVMPLPVKRVVGLSSSPPGLGAFLGHVSTWYRNSDVTLLYSLSCPLQDVVDVVARVRLVGVLHRKPRLLSSCKEVLVLVVLVVVTRVIVIVSVSVSATARLQVLERPQTRHAALLRRLWLCGLRSRRRG